MNTEKHYRTVYRMAIIYGISLIDFKKAIIYGISLILKKPSTVLIERVSGKLYGHMAFHNFQKISSRVLMSTSDAGLETPTGFSQGYVMSSTLLIIGSS